MAQDEAIKLFDINEYLQEKKVDEHQSNSSMDYQDLLKQVKKHFNDILEDESLSNEELQKRQDIEHQATIGDEKSEIFLVNEIDDYLKSEQITNVNYPSFFDSLAHAIFHEIYRFGVFHKWYTYENSPSAKIQGKEIWFKINGKFQKQSEELRDEEQVKEIIRALGYDNKGLKVNEENPTAEIEMKDGTRVTIISQPRSYKPTIVFRRFIVNSFSFKTQANHQTISRQDIDFFKDISRVQLNTIIAGEVESGKSTFLKTVYGERDPEKVALLIETSPESYLKRDFPKRLVHDFYSNNADINDVIRTALRVDHDYIIVQEVRGHEAEGAISGTERGRNGLLMTYHITSPERTPEQLAQHIVDVFPNRVFQNEVRRISKALDVGITMKTFEGNKKKVTSLYEICYSFEDDSAWINYLMVYNDKTNSWEYNKNISEQLKQRLYNTDEELAKRIEVHLEKRAEEQPLKRTAIQPINFKF